MTRKTILAASFVAIFAALMIALPLGLADAVGAPLIKSAKIKTDANGLKIAAIETFGFIPKSGAALG
jgi:hypothetical protein